jgi:ATP-dependent Clp protease ATP-binding subunit ClpC
MFERYTEPARRALFFARYEASQFGSLSIEAEHLLLGLIREEKAFTSRIFEAANLSRDSVGEEIRRRTDSREKVGTGVEIPFSAETKRILQCAADQADNLLHQHIGPEHLMLGLLREEKSFAASILHKHGVNLAAVRDEVAAATQGAREAGPRDPVDAAAEVEQVKKLVDRLSNSLADQEAAKKLIEQIGFYVERLQERFRPKGAAGD